MVETGQAAEDLGWRREEACRRQIRAGLAMTPAARLAWSEETLDEILPLVGLAREAERAREKSRG